MKFFITVILILLVANLKAQNTELVGIVKGVAGVEAIHITNATQNINTTTNGKGEFTLEGKKGDTIKVSAVQYLKQSIVITSEHIISKQIIIKLQLQVNQLDEVVIKPNKLTGNLTDDITNSKAKRTINFYDVGIPGYTGKPLTQNERRLKEAGGNQKMFNYYVIAGSFNLNKFLNHVTGRTKKLKERIRVETNTNVMKGIKNRIFEDFLKKHSLQEDQIMDFFYFCLEDTAFESSCKNKSDLEVMAYLEQRYKKYISNTKSNEE